MLLLTAAKNQISITCHLRTHALVLLLRTMTDNSQRKRVYLHMDSRGDQEYAVYDVARYGSQSSIPPDGIPEGL